LFFDKMALQMDKPAPAATAAATRCGRRDQANDPGSHPARGIGRSGRQSPSQYLHDNDGQDRHQRQDQGAFHHVQTRPIPSPTHDPSMCNFQAIGCFLRFCQDRFALLLISMTCCSLL
jgi:hypothetical protein